MKLIQMKFEYDPPIEQEIMAFPGLSQWTVDLFRLDKTNHGSEDRRYVGTLYGRTEEECVSMAKSFCRLPELIKQSL